MAQSQPLLHGSIFGSPQQGTFSCNDDGRTLRYRRQTHVDSVAERSAGTLLRWWCVTLAVLSWAPEGCYSQAVAAALDELPTELVVYQESFELDYPYHLQGVIEPLWQQFDVRVSDSQFTEQVHQRLELIPDELEPLQERLDAVSQGQLKLRKC